MFYSQIPKGRDMLHLVGGGGGREAHVGKTRVSQEAERVRGNVIRRKK